jgi:hypothetical protein
MFSCYIITCWCPRREQRDSIRSLQPARISKVGLFQLIVGTFYCYMVMPRDDKRDENSETHLHNYGKHHATLSDIYYIVLSASYADIWLNVHLDSIRTPQPKVFPSRSWTKRRWTMYDKWRTQKVMRLIQMSMFTAFSFGFYQFKCMPFGFTNTPVTFQRSQGYVYGKPTYDHILDFVWFNCVVLSSR